MELKLDPNNLKKYLPFFQQSADCACTLGLFYPDGRLNMLAHEADRDDFEILIKHIEISDFTAEANSLSTPNFVNFGSDGTLAKAALLFAHCQQPYWLAGLFKAPAHEINHAHQSKAINILKNIAACLVEDYTLQLTLSGMVDELAVRYEELNLIYGLDDTQTNHTSFDEQQALNHLISNCTDFMNVDFAAIYAPELDMSLEQIKHTPPDPGLIASYHSIQKPLYHYLVATEKTLVINQNRDIDWTDANLKTSNKILAAPIMLSKHHLAGILVLMNAPHGPDFSNSDRKLCDVLASEAAKMIQARRDNVTGLLNRRGFTEKLQETLTFIKKSPTKCSLLFLDIDQFKIINDLSGQKAGDQLLDHIGSLITKSLSYQHVVGRLGADEYGVLLEHIDLDKAKEIAEYLSQVINQFRFAYQDKLYDISVCIGIVELLPTFDDFSTPLSSANLACNVAKEQGRNRMHIYQASDQEMIRHESQMLWVSRIHLALEQERFRIYRQKITPLNTKSEAKEHYELLLRLIDENGNLLTPFNFIPAAERYNLMPQLDRWVLKTALIKMAAVLQADPESTLSCSINLSGQSFCEPGFIEFVTDQINKSGISAERIHFEITETAAISNLSQSIKFIETLKKIGCCFSLDDFGSGMSSFTYLKNLPVDYLKIDGYFVKNMLTNTVDYAMVKSINEIGHVMGLRTIAEFVENDQIFQELASLGIDYGQGYGIAKPEPFE